VGDQGVVFDPDVHVAGDAKKGVDVGEVLALRPFADLGDLGVVWDAAFVGALVSEDGDFRPCDGELLGGNSGSGTEEAVEDAMDIVDMHPNESADLQVSWNRLVPSILGFETGLGAFDVCVVQKGLGGVQDLRLQDKDDISVEDRHGASPTLWHTS